MITIIRSPVITVIDDILERYGSLQHLNQPQDVIALKAVSDALRARNNVVISRSLWRDLCTRTVWRVKEVTNDDTPGS